MIPSEDTLLQAINPYYPDVWPCSLEDWKKFAHDNKVIKQKKDEKINQEFLEWVENLTSQENMEDALRRLSLKFKEIRGSDKLEELVAHVLVTCFTTSPFVIDLHRDQWKLRDEHRDHLRNSEKQLGGLEEFMEGCKADRNNRYKIEEIKSSSGFLLSLESEGLKLINDAPNKLRLSIDLLSDLIDDHIRQLKFELSGPTRDFNQKKQEFLQQIESDVIVDSKFSKDNDSFFQQLDLEGTQGPDFVRNKICSLIYPKDIPRQARGEVSIVNSLLFHLSFLFRQYTSPDSDGRWLKNVKGEMPSDGRPHNAQVTDIAHTLLSFVVILKDGGQKLSAQKVRQRVNKLTRKGVQLGSLFTVDF